MPTSDRLRVAAALAVTALAALVAGCSSETCLRNSDCATGYYCSVGACAPVPADETPDAAADASLDADSGANDAAAGDADAGDADASDADASDADASDADATDGDLDADASDADVDADDAAAD